MYSCPPNLAPPVANLTVDKFLVEVLQVPDPHMFDSITNDAVLREAITQLVWQSQTSISHFFFPVGGQFRGDGREAEVKWNIRLRARFVDPGSLVTPFLVPMAPPLSLPPYTYPFVSFVSNTESGSAAIFGTGMGRL